MADTQRKIPAHVAIIMDGNGRWAKKRGLPRTMGHAQGAKVVEQILEDADHMGIRYLTVYAFSTENWKRSIEEVKYIMSLPALFFKKYMKEFMRRNYSMHILGEMDALPEATRNVLIEAVEESKNNTGLHLNLAVNYGSHREIILAAKQYAKDVKEGKASEDLTEELFESYLMTKDFPPVDLLIRTSGEQRISNYLLWQIAYAELEFVPESWPEFTPEVLKRCIEEYQTRDRRFGGVTK